MTTTTFRADPAHQLVNWNDPARWSGGVVPNSPTVDVIIPEITLIGSGTPYASFINVTAAYTVSSLSITFNDLVFNAAGTLTVAHNLTVSDQAEITMNGGGSLSADSIDNNGILIQGSGNITTTGLFLNETWVAGGLNLTAGSLTNAGILQATGGSLTVTVTPGGFTNLSGSTLASGIYRAGGLWGTGNNIYFNVGSVIDTDAANILIDGGAVYSYDDVSHAYVSLTSSLHSVAGSGTLWLAHQAFAWSNLTVDGSVTLNSATLSSSQLTVDAGGKVAGIGTLGGAIVNNGTVIAGPVDGWAINTGDTLLITGTISGSGTIEIAPARVTTYRGITTYTSVPLELSGAASSTVVFDDGRGTLKLDDVAEFSGKIAPVASGGDIILLRGISYDSVTSYNYSGDSHGGTLAIQTTGGEIELQFLGDFITNDFFLLAGPRPLSSDPATLQIAHIGSPGSVSINDVQITEGNSGAKVATFTVTRSGGASAFDVNFVTSDGSATTADHDYNGTSGTLHFALGGANTQTISVTINGDYKVEPDQTFFVNLSGATNRAVISDGQGVGTIKNDDHATANDFNGDGKSDILWRNDAGALAIWDMNDGNLLTSNPLGSVPDNWKVAGTGDFNGDGKTDILWRNDTGPVAIWDMNDGNILASNSLGSVPANWHIAGVGDFNGDGKSDILWRNDAGAIATWDMNDGNLVSSNSLGSVPDSWKIAGLGDFNGDGKSDILWRNDTGPVAIWDVNDGTLVSSNSLGSVPANWHIAGTGDFNGDSKSDILWRNDAGAIATWDMNDGTLLSSNSLGSVPDNWKIAGIGDYNGDHKSDILWRNDAGPVAIWDMDDGTLLSSNPLGSVPANWHIIA
jgi:ribosomal protein S28E/S33